MSIMKKYLFIIVITFIASACEDMMKEDPINKLIINSDSDLEFALTGLYHQFTNITGGMQLQSNKDDVAIIGNSSSTRLFICTKQGTSTTPEDGTLLTLYLPLYKTIACANDIFSKSKNLNQKDPKIYHLLGEAYFIRAYSYFWLVRMFGQVPIIDNVDVSYTVKRATFLEIYRFIENDLQTAIKMLPGSNNEARFANITPHRGSAKALLAEVYLSWAGYPLKEFSMYSKAASTAKDVIDSAAYFGFALMDDMADLWNGKHNVNHEAIFAFHASATFSETNSYGQQKGIKMLATDNYFFYIVQGEPAIKFYNAFPNNYRKDVSYDRNRRYIFQPNCIVDSLNPLKTYCPPAETIEYRIDSINLCSTMYFGKYDLDVYSNNTPHSTNSYYINTSFRNKFRVIYMIRYAHTLLTYAEAKARAGEIDASVFEAVNQVRRRANKVDLQSTSVFDLSYELTAQQVADSVFWERAWEFCLEPEGRWFDLLRLELIPKLASLKDNAQGTTYPIWIDTKTCFFPIPKADLNLNLNLQ
jgi:hypothetical protein